MIVAMLWNDLSFKDVGSFDVEGNRV